MKVKLIILPLVVFLLIFANFHHWKRYLRKLAKIVILLLIVVAICKVPTEGEETLAKEEVVEVVKVSIQPKYSLNIMSKKYSPMIHYLSEETGYKIRLVSALSYSSYFHALEANQVDIAFQNPLAYIILHKTRDAYPLVKTVGFDGMDKYRGTIITHKDNGIETINDLKGKDVAIASRMALCGYLGQVYLCRESGIDVEKELSIVLMQTQDDVILNVYRQKVDAGFVSEDALPEVKEKIDLGEIKIVEHTDYFPTWCVAAFRNTKPEVAEKIKKALLKLDSEIPQQRDILEAMGGIGFAEANDSDYKLNVSY